MARIVLTEKGKAYIAEMEKRYPPLMPALRDAIEQIHVEMDAEHELTYEEIMQLATEGLIVIGRSEPCSGG